MGVMGKYIVSAFVIIIIIAGGFYWLHTGGASATPPSGQQTAPTQTATSTYTSATYSVVYPIDFTVDPSYQYTGVPKKPIAGVKFTVPGSMATGTNLGADSYVSIETLPRAKICTGDIYLPTNVTSQTITDNGMQYSLATSTDIGAGNLYEEQVYAFPGSSPCTAVRYFIHSTQVGNTTTGTVQPFDRTGLLNAFDAIRHSVTLGSSSAPVVPAPTTSQ